MNTKGTILLVRLVALLISLVAETKVLADGQDLRFAPQVKLPVTLDLQAYAEVNRAVITLSDVARCQDHTGICEEAFGVIVGPSPVPGGNKSFSRDHIVNILRMEWPNADFKMTGSAVVSVKARGFDIPEAELEKVVQETFRSANKNPSVRIEVRNITLSGHSLLRPASYEVRLSELPDLTKRSAHSLEFFVIQEGETRKIKALVQVDTYVLTPVAQHLLAPRTVLKERDFRMDWLKQVQTGQVILEVNRLVGMETRVRIPEGAPFASTSVAAPILVHRGEVIDVLVQRGNVAIKMRAQAMDKGAMGDVIPVKGVFTNRVIQAKLLGRSQAEAQL